MKIDGECLIELIGSYKNKIQVYRSVRMTEYITNFHTRLETRTVYYGML